MKLIHETSPLVAVYVVRTLCLEGGPIQADDGLNAWLVDHPNGPYMASQLENYGAILEFEWTGKMVRSEGNYWAPNLLHDQHPLRAFVPAGTNDHLYLVDIRFRPNHGWADVVLEPTAYMSKPRSWIDWISSKSPKWKSLEADRITDEVLHVIQQKPKVRVVSSRKVV